MPILAVVVWKLDFELEGSQFKPQTKHVRCSGSRGMSEHCQQSTLE